MWKSKKEPLRADVPQWSNPYARQPYFPCETVYKQFGYLWVSKLLHANYTKHSAKREVTSIDRQVARMRPTPLAQWNPSEDGFYRVCIDPLTGKVEVICIGIDHEDPDTEGVYADTSALPSWVQDRLAVLSIMSSKAPTQLVEGVGQRIDNNTFWVLR